MSSSQPIIKLESRGDLEYLLEKMRTINYNIVFDVHCHVDSDMYSEEKRKEVIGRAIENRVKMVTVPLSNEERLRALRLYEEYHDWIYIVTGSHPLIDEDLGEVEQFIRENIDKIVGIGEVGLDFKPPNNSFDVMKKQTEKFEFFIDLAFELDKPLVIHSRSAGRQSIEVLLRKRAERVLMHAFSGNVKYVRRGVQAGYYFSVPPTAFRNKQKINLVKVVPIEQLMLETDSPVLAPLPNMINEPMNVLISAYVVAVIKGMDPKEVIDQTTRNAREFFKIK